MAEVLGRVDPLEAEDEADVVDCRAERRREIQGLGRRPGLWVQPSLKARASLCSSAVQPINSPLLK